MRDWRAFIVAVAWIVPYGIGMHMAQRYVGTQVPIWFDDDVRRFNRVHGPHAKVHENPPGVYPHDPAGHWFIHIYSPLKPFPQIDQFSYPIRTRYPWGGGICDPLMYPAPVNHEGSLWVCATVSEHLERVKVMR